MGRKQNADRGIYARTLPSGAVKYYIRFAWQGRDIRLTGGDTKEQARRTLRKTLTDLERGTIQLVPRQADTVAGAIERWRPLAKQLRNYTKTQAIFTWWTERHGNTPLARLTPLQIEQAQTTLLELGKSPATVNRYTDWFRHVLNREVKLGYLAHNPVTRITRLAEPEAPVHQYTHAQEAALIKALGPAGSWVRLAILTGLRQGEQFGIKKEWIHRDDGFIQIPTSKANRPRIVLLTKEIASIVEALCAKHPDSPYLFPSPRNPEHPINAHTWYTKVFRPACEVAKLPTDLKWHTLRHTFGSRLVASGANTKEIQALGGWTTDKAANRYMHLRPSDLLAVAERLSRPAPAPKTKKVRSAQAS